MNPSLAKKILEELQESSLQKMQQTPHFLLPLNSSYTPVAFTEDNFHTLTPTASSKSFVFVDGGNAELVKTPDFSLQFLRFAAVGFQQQKRTFVKTQEGYILVKTQRIDDALFFVTKGFEGLQTAEPLIIAANDPLLVDVPERTKPGIVATLFRSLLELHFAAHVVPEHGVLVLDRPLFPANSYEYSSFHILHETVKKNNTLLSGLAKTTALLCNTGESVVVALDRFQKSGLWLYYPVFSTADLKHKALVSFVKLHPTASHLFRFEGATIDSDLLKEVATLLAGYSTDAFFPGYPYGLIVADQHARISKKEEEYRKTLFFSYIPSQHFALSALNAHDVLDQRSNHQLTL